MFGASRDRPSAAVGAVDDADPERWLTEGFRAPEGVWKPDADRIRLDVFGLGALAFYLLSGQPPAPTAKALKTRLHDQQGLDLAIELPAGLLRPADPSS